VYVAFEDGRMDTPVVIGKLYLGTEKEKADPRGVSNVEESSTAKKATLPADSKLTVEIDDNVPNTTTPYSSLSSIANGLNTLNTNVGQMDRDYGNKFKQVIATTDGMQSTIEQNSNSIKNSVLHKRSEGGEEQDLGNGLTTKGLGWHLDTDKWVIKAYDQQKNADNQDMLPADGLEIFKIDRTTVEINAPNVKLAGYPRTITIRYAYSDSNKSYPSLDPSDTTVWTETNLDPENNKYIWQWTQTIKYDYDEKTNKWNDIITDKVICLTGTPGEPGVSIVSQTTYYALIDPVYETGDIKAPESDDNLAVIATNGSPLAENRVFGPWTTTPPEHNTVTLQGSWKYWTTIRTEKSDGEISYSSPIVNEDTSGAYAVAQEAYALAQGKTTNYYSVDDPTKKYVVKKGDCWFQTISSDDENYNGELNGNQGKLYQWNGEIWEDIGGELVTNKLTANYINALDITAKQITVLQDKEDQDSILFQADGLSDVPSVKIAGFNVEANTLTTGSTENGNLIKLNSDSNSQYSFYQLTNSEYAEVIEDYTDSISIKPFEKADSLWEYNNQSYLVFSTSNYSTINYQYAITKITFTKKIEQTFKFYIRDTGTSDDDYVIVSTLNAQKAPITYDDSYVQNYTRNKGDGLEAITFDAPISANTFFYIVYKHGSSNRNSLIGGQVYLPVDVRMSIGDNFQVLADGSVYANNLFLGGITKEPSGSPDDSEKSQLSGAAGQLAALEAKIDSVEAKHIEIKNGDDILFKADAREKDTSGNTIENKDRIQLGGWIIEEDRAIPEHGWIFRSKSPANQPAEMYPDTFSSNLDVDSYAEIIDNINNGYYDATTTGSKYDSDLSTYYSYYCLKNPSYSGISGDFYPVSEQKICWEISDSAGINCSKITGDIYIYGKDSNSEYKTQAVIGTIYIPQILAAPDGYLGFTYTEYNNGSYEKRVPICFKTNIVTLENYVSYQLDYYYVEDIFMTYYVFYYMCNKGFRMRICYSDDFNDVVQVGGGFVKVQNSSTTITDPLGLLDFDICDLSNFERANGQVQKENEKGTCFYS
jgi:hypothetical protein